MNKSKCSSCGAEVYWVVTPNGKRMPLDVNPWMIAVFGDRSKDGVTIDSENVDRFVRGYNSHFSSCPNAAAHRSKT